jgi:hypothetical protein
MQEKLFSSIFRAATSSGVSQPAQITVRRQSRLMHGFSFSPSGFIDFFKESEDSLKFLKAFLSKITEVVIPTNETANNDIKMILTIIIISPL